MITNFLNKLNWKSLEQINHSKYFAGITMLLLNLGSRFLVAEISDNQQQLLNNKIVRRFIIFTVFFVATKDIWVSLILTSVFIILVTGLFNENSKYCIVTKSVYNNITDEEYNHAIKIIKLYNIQKQNNKIHN
jgi:hypothetical protein